MSVNYGYYADIMPQSKIWRSDRIVNINRIAKPLIVSFSPGNPIMKKAWVSMPSFFKLCTIPRAASGLTGLLTMLS